MKIAVLIARILLGLIFLVFGINFFYPFLHMTPPPMSAQATAFSGGLYGSGYFFQYMKVIEIVSAIFILLNRFTAFFLLILFPVSLNIFLYHAVLAPAGIPVGTVVMVLNIFLGIAHWKYYEKIFTFEPKV